MIEATHKDNVVDNSEAFVGRWNKLVSTTNWEKGKIIHQWRMALMDSELPSNEFSDEVWAERVGNISSQHVGRLRRVFDRFDQSREQYPSLYWSHFSQAIEWDDAEMWLEGAVQNSWSVAEMRNQRSQTMGLIDTSPVQEASGSLDEDALEADEAPLAPSLAVAQDFERSYESQTDFGDESDDCDDAPEMQDSVARNSEPEARVRPFESLPTLPEDLFEGLEEFKLAIVRHKLARWEEVPREHLLAHLDALRALVLAPSED